MPLEAGRGRAIACACGPARRSPSTASCSRARASIDESMVTGEAIPVEKHAGDRVDRRDRQRHGLARHEGRDASARTRCSRGSCAMVARRSAAAHRSSGWPTSLRAGSSRSCSAIAVLTFVVWALGRAGAAHGPRARQRRRRADHRVSLRTGSGHADVDHGRDRRGAKVGVLVPRRRGDRDSAKGRHARRRQDRHADRGTSRSSSPWLAAEGADEAEAAPAGGEPRARERAPARGGDRGRCGGAQRGAVGGGRTSRRSRARACAGPSTGAHVALGNARTDGRARRRTRAARPSGPKRCGARGRR